jgi:phosphoketolase
MNDNTTTTATPIPDEFKLLHRYWQASNYLSVGQVRNWITSQHYLIGMYLTTRWGEDCEVANM